MGAHIADEVSHLLVVEISLVNMRMSTMKREN
jgi:hypothetical protein